MRFWRVLGVLLVLSPVACRSLDGLTGGDSKDAGSSDTGSDVVAQPCTAVPGSAVVCVKVATTPGTPTPGYGAFSGSGTVGADGTGFVQVFLFDKDPTDPANGHVLPKVTLRHPPAAGEKTSIDALPAELVGAANEGTYWVYALFEDNDVDSRGTGLLTAVPGDFVTPLNINGQGDLYPTVALVKDQAVTLDLELIPLRKLTLNASAGVGVTNPATTNTSIHGDGPASFFLYDGDLMTGKPTVTDFGQISCLDLDLQNPNKPAVVPVWFGVESTGEHNLFGSLYDYENPVLTSSTPPGSLVTNAASPPTASIDPTQWTATADVVFSSIVNAQPAGTNDPLHCK